MLLLFFCDSFVVSISTFSTYIVCNKAGNIGSISFQETPLTHSPTTLPPMPCSRSLAKLAQWTLREPCGVHETNIEVDRYIEAFSIVGTQVQAVSQVVFHVLGMTGKQIWLTETSPKQKSLEMSEVG